MIGGVQAVTWADVKQMVLIVGALIAIVIVILLQLPVGPSEALHAGRARRPLRVFDFSFDLNQTYTFWSGIIGGTFLMLSVFRDRPEPGTAVSHRAIGRRGPHLAPDERVLEDPPPGADPADRASWSSCSTSSSAPPLLFNPAHERARAAAQPAEYAALSAPLSDRVCAAEAAARSATQEPWTRQANSGPTSVDVRTEALALAAAVTGRRRAT